MPDPHTASRGEPLSEHRRHALHRFYSTHHRRLAIAVLGAVYGITRWQLDDICSYAWLRLAHRPDITLDRRGYRWLTTVAIREGWRLTDALDPIDHTTLDSAAADGLEHALAALEHDTRVQRLQQLTPLQQRDLLLAAAGYSYHEIAALTGSTYTAVNRHLRDGRARLRNPKTH